MLPQDVIMTGQHESTPCETLVELAGIWSSVSSVHDAVNYIRLDQRFAHLRLVSAPKPLRFDQAYPAPGMS